LMKVEPCTVEVPQHPDNTCRKKKRKNNKTKHLLFT
jgi:hypothetical protein